MHDLFGDDEDEIGKRDSQRRFGQSIVACPRDQLQQRPPGQEAQSCAAEEGNQELLLANEEVRLLSRYDHPKQHCEHHDRGGVVQKRLALDEAGAHVEYLHQLGQLRISNLDQVAKSRDPVIEYVRR